MSAVHDECVGIRVGFGNRSTSLRASGSNCSKAVRPANDWVTDSISATLCDSVRIQRPGAGRWSGR